MATFEQFNVLLQINDQITRLSRNIRANANGYITQADALDAGTLPAGYSVAVIASNMNADGAAFNVRLQTLTDIASRNQTLVQNALGIIGVTLAQANGFKNTLVSVATTLQQAVMVTTDDIRTQANAVLTNAPNFDGLF